MNPIERYEFYRLFGEMRIDSVSIRILCVSLVGIMRIGSINKFMGLLYDKGVTKLLVVQVSLGVSKYTNYIYLI